VIISRVVPAPTFHRKRGGSMTFQSYQSHRYQSTM